MRNLINRVFYQMKPFIPRPLQIIIRRWQVVGKLTSYANVWPIDEEAKKKPDGWSGWPDQKKFALVLTHDVEKSKGLDKCYKLISLEERLGFRSSFNFVAEGYDVPAQLRRHLSSKGFEVGVHGLFHDGKDYDSMRIFRERAIKINHYLKKWGSVGFRSPSMHNNLEWIQELDIEYDASTFDTDPFEPKPKGMGTIFPFFVRVNPSRRGYIELPYTLPQDFTLFILMKQRTIDIWKNKLDWIVKNGGMVLLITHPDYMSFDRNRLRYEEYPAEYYEEFLEYVTSKYGGQYWHALPKDMANFWAKI